MPEIGHCGSVDSDVWPYERMVHPLLEEGQSVTVATEDRAQAMEGVERAGRDEAHRRGRRLDTEAESRAGQARPWVRGSRIVGEAGYTPWIAPRTRSPGSRDPSDDRPCESLPATAPDPSSQLFG
jgi:hypothetical protein